MNEDLKPYCPECEEPGALDRRGFIRVLGAAPVGLAALGAAGLPSAARAKPALRAAKPAEALIRELYSTLSDDQKKQVVYPWDHKKNGALTRTGMYNQAIGKTIGTVYDKKQQELVERILRSISANDEAYDQQITRNGTFDASKTMENCGADVFGDPSGSDKFAWVFSGHHLTVRCDGNSEEGAAFGGPMYYGHSPNGYSKSNVFNYQTRAAQEVFEALTEKQRKKAVIPYSENSYPGEQIKSVQFRKEHPGIVFADLTRDQVKLVEDVMRAVLSPYRKEDADEVMEIVKANGGLEKMHLAFYDDKDMKDREPWHFWRLEGPGFVWNYRVLPHVHTYVNISSKI